MERTTTFRIDRQIKKIMADDDDKTITLCSFCADEALIELDAGACNVCGVWFCSSCEQGNEGCKWACSCEPACKGKCVHERNLVCDGCIEDDNRIVGIEADD